MPDIAAEYRIIQTGAGWADRSGRGRLRFEGRDVVGFLQGLLSNDVATIGPGGGVYATWLTPQGRLVADFRIYHRGDALVADVVPGLAADLAGRLDQLIFAEDVRVADVSSATALVTVVGAGAADVLSRAFGLDARALATLRPLGQIDAGAGAFVIRADESEWPMFDVWMPAADSDNVISRLASGGARAISADLLEVLRIEAGRPAFGIDMTTETIPLEAGLLDRAISTTKGCYVGQEVIIRVLHRGHGRVARKLVGLAFEGGSAPASGMAVEAGGREVGRITSSALSAALERPIALAYLHRDFVEPGTKVSAGGHPGVVTALPFVRQV